LGLPKENFSFEGTRCVTDDCEFVSVAMRSSPRAIAAALVASCLLPCAQTQGLAPTNTNGTGPLSQFKSRPDIYAPFLNISLYDENAVTPGYIFMGPYQTFQEAVYIYDNRGVSRDP